MEGVVEDVIKSVIKKGVICFLNNVGNIRSL